MRQTVYIWGTPERFANYRRWVESAGGRAVFGKDAGGREIRWDALLLPGGGDLEPWRYGRENTASRGLEPERDGAELRLLQEFTAAGKPVLGVCRGLQTINVFFGGTLAQDIPGHGAWEGGDRLHGVQNAPGLALWGEGLTVNSAHHQAADRLGSGLRAVQWAEDGVVEALRHERLPVWAVQWHPERLGDPVPGRRLMEAFLNLGR
ncbi:gamma-glutamyl-gamma-aminobutyrate hydrolase family protein [uncultured Oscillibacter sp.]|uniref:gamma-glutamyl-gamma-aminobutyrate hydrolase family protein n=1 Tax=uncultured Oscillibacter sp. TaxID=876091 RepID=UPI00272C0F99|nr:type 1 glutamine amidotransferase [uncultured Oscillibacter sp.]